MQTFFPVAGDAEASLLYLDERRRRNQINETFVILNTLLSNRTTGWPNHPATLMWEGYIEALASYGLINALMFDGYSRQRQAFSDVLSAAEPRAMPVVWPKWTRDDRVAQSHRANLYRKLPTYYPETPAQGYVWPVWRRVKPGGFLLGTGMDGLYRGRIVSITKTGLRLMTESPKPGDYVGYSADRLLTWAQAWGPGRYYYEAPLA